MRTVAPGYETAIAASTVKVAELYDIELSNGTIFYRTNHSEDILWGGGGNLYLAAQINRGPISRSIDGEVESCEMEWSDLDGTPYSSIQKHSLNGAKITIRRILWNTAYAAGWEIIAFVGHPNVRWDRRGIQLVGHSIFGSLHTMVPRDVYQEPCNRALFDAVCSLVQANYAYSGTATSGTTQSLIDASAGTLYKVDFDAGDETNPIARGETITGGTNGYTAVVVQIIYLTAATGTIWYLELSNSANFNNDEVLSSGGDTITVNGTPAEDVTFYQKGELKMTSGANNGERRMILSASGNTRTIFLPFPSAIATNDTYLIYPGCDYSTQRCHLRFDNSRNFRGWPYLASPQDQYLGPQVTSRRTLKV